MNLKNRVARTAIVLLALVTTVVFAADLDQAKRDGLVGERADGYLGLIVESARSDIVAIVAEVNAKRKAEYQRIAATNNLTMEQVQALAGKKTIELTKKGDWILINGGWQRK